MATIINTLSADSVKMRYREPFLTAGLNAKNSFVAPGTYRGWYLATNIANNAVSVVADPVKGDHVAVYQTVAGFSLTLVVTGGDLNVSLASLVDVVEKTWVIALFAEYAVGTTTAGQIRAYELDPTDEFTIAAENPELVVLGTVTIPASSAAPIPAGNITSDRRRYAWAATPPDAVAWTPLVKNSSFEYGEVVPGTNTERTIPFWVFESGGGDVDWNTAADATAPSGDRALNIDNTVTTSIGSAWLQQNIGATVVTGQQVRVRYSYKVLKDASSGSIKVHLITRDASLSDANAYSSTIDITSATVGYVEVEKVYEMETTDAVLSHIQLDFVGATWGSTGDAIRFGYIQVELEDGEAREGINSPLDISYMILRDKDGLEGNDVGAMLAYDQSTGQVDFGMLPGSSDRYRLDQPRRPEPSHFVRVGHTGRTQRRYRGDNARYRRRHLLQRARGWV
jgi:hypothetical protein